VQVRRIFGKSPGDTIQIQCEFRMPIALVEDQGWFWLIDQAGIKLPERFGKSEIGKVLQSSGRAIQMRVITGVASQSPQSGNVWQGDDLIAGVDLIKTLSGKPGTSEVVTVDVSNFAGRRDLNAAQIVLYRADQGELRWGRPVNASDFFVEVPVERKLKYIEVIDRDVRAGKLNSPWYDLRFDSLLVDKDARVTATAQ